MVSLLASKVSVTFYIELTKLEGFEKTSNFCPHFDCRVFQVETLKNVLENISERVKFTLKNSRMMLAQSHYSQKVLNKLASRQAVEKLLTEKGIDFNEVVPGDNRVGNILLWEKVNETKTIEVKGETKVINYERKKCKLLNCSPTEVN